MAMLSKSFVLSAYRDI